MFRSEVLVYLCIQEELLFRPSYNPKDHVIIALLTIGRVFLKLIPHRFDLFEGVFWFQVQNFARRL